MLLRLTTALIGGLTACAVMAADFQPVDTIKAAALGALPVGADADATLDPALRLPRCGAALVARVQGSNSVEVACPDGWRLFVPVRVRRSQTVLVLISPSGQIRLREQGAHTAAGFARLTTAVDSLLAE